MKSKIVKWGVRAGKGMAQDMIKRADFCTYDKNFLVSCSLEVDSNEYNFQAPVDVTK